MKENALQLWLERVSLVEIVAGFGHNSLRSGVAAGGGGILYVRSRRRAQLFVARILMGYGALLMRAGAWGVAAYHCSWSMVWLASTVNI